MLNSQAQGVFGKNEQPTYTPWRGASEARGLMQLHRLHRLEIGPAGRHVFAQYPLQCLPVSISMHDC